MIKSAISSCVMFMAMSCVAQSSTDIAALPEHKRVEEQVLLKRLNNRKHVTRDLIANEALTTNNLSSLDFGDTDKGILINRLNQDQIDYLEMSLGISEEGMMVYNTDDSRLQIWNGVRWMDNGIQKLSIQDNNLQIEGREDIDLSKFKDNTDQQNLTEATLNGTKLTIDIENGDPVTVDLAPIFNEYEERLRRLEALLLEGENYPENDEREQIAPKR